MRPFTTPPATGSETFPNRLARTRTDEDLASASRAQPQPGREPKTWISKFPDVPQAVIRSVRRIIRRTILEKNRRHRCQVDLQRDTVQ